MSHEQVKAKNIPYTSIYNPEIVDNRRHIQAPNGKSLWSFVNLYFNPRNAMLYQALRKEGNRDEIVLLEVQANKILNRYDIFISTGNAAHSLSKIMPIKEAKKHFSEIKEIIGMEWWKPEDGSKRKMMAECLVPDRVPLKQIRAIYVANHEIKNEIEKKFQTSLPVIPEPSKFFLHSEKAKLGQCLSIVEGDMFFSRMQTLTISVNCVGVMGKGLASRAKEQFSDVYVQYQEACRKGKLKIGQLFLYKRESSLDQSLADEPSVLRDSDNTWFLLFPTKQHWKGRADIQGIEEGLRWIQNNYRKEGISSLAIPALGCGLGGLEWRDVGPLMYKFLYNLHIPVQIYLPAEKKIPSELLSEDFLSQR